MKAPEEVELCLKGSTVVVVESRMPNGMAEALFRVMTPLAMGNSGAPTDCTLETFLSGQRGRTPRGSPVVAGRPEHRPRSFPQAAPRPPRRPGHGSPYGACGPVS